MPQYLCCIAWNLFIEFTTYVVKKLLLHKEALKWINITACSKPSTIQMANPVVMHEVWSITKDCAVTRLNLA